MTDTIRIQPLTAEAFAPFGDVLDCAGDPTKLINNGMCGRYHDRAKLDFSDGRAGISLFKAKLRALPMRLELVERHPEGSQAFLPLDSAPFVVVVAPDENGKPGRPLAFITSPGQGVNYHRGVWHGVLAPVSGNGLFAVVDRIGSGANLEEFPFDSPPTLILE
jgi:ureidoglycolate lyase